MVAEAAGIPGQGRRLVGTMGSKGTSGGIFKVSEQDNQLQPFDTAQGEPHMPENPTPQDYGFPEKPSSLELQRWQRQQRWLAAYADSGSVGAACLETGIPPSTAFSWDAGDIWSFKKRREFASVAFLGKVEAELNRRTFEGYDKPLVYKGELTRDSNGEIVSIKYKEPTDLYFLAKKHEPAYRDNYQPQQSDTHIAITQTIITVRDYQAEREAQAGRGDNQGAIVEGESRELPEASPENSELVEERREDKS
jgi:hypothetical protein